MLTPVSKEKEVYLGKLRGCGKIMNFSVLYGSGVKGLATFLQGEFPHLPWSKLTEIAKLAIKAKKGTTDREGVFSGGTDSGAFNMMDKIAIHSPTPSLPTLGTKITTALRPSVVGRDFLPGRRNWAIQGTGAEILSIFLVAVHWLAKKKGITTLFIISIHDEIWWLFREEDTEMGVKILQLAHLYTWGLFNAQLGMPDLALNNAFFSGIAVDDRVRKGVDESTVSPSNPNGAGEPPGKEYSAYDF
jgi:hypothetical protein